jgi:hypothetical protein
VFNVCSSSSLVHHVTFIEHHVGAVIRFFLARRRPLRRPTTTVSPTDDDRFADRRRPLRRPTTTVTPTDDDRFAVFLRRSVFVYESSCFYLPSSFWWSLRQCPRIGAIFRACSCVVLFSSMRVRASIYLLHFGGVCVNVPALVLSFERVLASFCFRL